MGRSFSSKEQASFNFMATVTICSDFGALPPPKKNKVSHTMNSMNSMKRIVVKHFKCSVECLNPTSINCFCYWNWYFFSLGTHLSQCCCLRETISFLGSGSKTAWESHQLVICSGDKDIGTLGLTKFEFRRGGTFLEKRCEWCWADQEINAHLRSILTISILNLYEISLQLNLLE